MFAMVCSFLKTITKYYSCLPSCRLDGWALPADTALNGQQLPLYSRHLVRIYPVLSLLIL